MKPLAPISSAETYDFTFLQNKQRRASGETGTIAVALVNNIAARRESNLFEALEQDKDEKVRDKVPVLRAMDSKHLVNREGKPVSLTSFQNKIVYALSLFVSQERNSDEIQLFIKKVNAGKFPKTTPILPISITELTKIVYQDGTARARQKEKVLEELRELAEVNQVQTFVKRDAAEDKVRLIAPLIRLMEQVEDLSPEKRMNADFICISFGTIFFYEVYTRYAVIKPSLFRIWGKRGSGTETELFNVLLADLLAKYSAHRIAALQAVKSIKQGKYKTEASYFAARTKAQENALTYSEMAHTLRSRVTTDYESTRKQKADFKKHLQNAIEALEEIGLITRAKITSTPTGDRLDFVFNIDYDKNEQGESIVIEQERQREIDALTELSAPEE